MPKGKKAKKKAESELWRKPWDPDSGHEPEIWQCRPESLGNPEIEVQTVWKEREDVALAAKNLDGVRQAFAWYVQTRTRGPVGQKKESTITWRFDNQFDQAIDVMFSIDQGAAVRVVHAVDFNAEQVPLCDAEHLVQLYAQLTLTRDEFKRNKRSAEDVAYVEAKMGKYFPILQHHCLLDKAESTADDMRKEQNKTEQTTAQPSELKPAIVVAKSQRVELLLDLDEAPDVFFSLGGRAGSSRSTRRPDKGKSVGNALEAQGSEDEDIALTMMRADEARQFQVASLHTQQMVLGRLDVFSEDSKRTNRELQRVQRQRAKRNIAMIAQDAVSENLAQIEDEDQASQSQQSLRRVPCPTHVQMGVGNSSKR